MYKRQVLDVGCGVNSPLEKIDRSFYLEGIDLIPVKDKIKGRNKSLKSKNAHMEEFENKIHDKYVRGDILHIEKYYKSKTFDAVVFFGVLEHLKRSEGKIFLEKMESIARKKVILTTPNGFIPQDPYAGNPYQEHVSGWFVKDFKIRKYKPYGLRGFKFIRGEFAAIKYKPWYLWLYFSYLSEFLTIKIPSFGFELMAVKTLNKK